ncbi:MAG: hypothetical protein U1E53_15340 [Dongiaceae bacterium]
MPILHLCDSDGARFWGHLELPALPRPGDLLAVGRHGGGRRLLQVDAVYPCGAGRSARRQAEEAVVQVTPLRRRGGGVSA